MGPSSATIISACGLWMLWFRIYMLLLLLMVLVCALMLTLLRLFIPSWKWFPSRLNCVINSWPRNLFSLIVWDCFVYEGVIATTVNTIPSDELDIVFNYNRIKLLYIYMDSYLYQCAIKYKGYMINNSMLLFRTLSDRREKCSKNSTKTYFFLILSLFHRRWGLFAFVAVLLLPGHSPLSIPHCVYAHVSLLPRWVHFYAGARVFAKIPSFVVFFAYQGRLPWRNLFYSCSTNFVETHGDQGPRSMFSLLFLLTVVVDHDYTHFSDLSLVDCGSTSI